MKFEFVSKEEMTKALKKFQSTHEVIHHYPESDFINETLDYVFGERKEQSEPPFHLPSRNSKKSAGYDFILPMDLEIKPHEQVMIPTMTKIMLDDDKMLLLYPRSSYGIKKGLMIANTVGVIDADYYNNQDNEGHIMIVLKNLSESNEPVFLKRGDKFSQGIIQPYFLVEDDSLEKGAERTGGIGSTGK